MLTLPPPYGETLLTYDEADALLPDIVSSLGSRPNKTDIYALEQGVQEKIARKFLSETFANNLAPGTLLPDVFCRELHRQLYGKIWLWAGIYRHREINLGVPPEKISTELRTALETLLYRWTNTRDWTAHEFGVAVHAEVVRIHPFADGNGRSSRLLADLVYLSCQDDETLVQYDWDLDKSIYIRLLGQYDRHRDPRELAAFINFILVSAIAPLLET